MKPAEPGPDERARLEPPHEVLEIARRLEDAGFETWCVGGAVRDALLGHPHLDWDLATAAEPSQVQRLFRRTVPVGIEFGTVGVLDRRGRLHEVTTFRRDVKTDGRHAVVEFGASLDDDLARRDFTINAIAWSPTRHVLHDPFGGREDLARRVVRAVGEPEARMTEDRLRALRAIRFAARLGFEIDGATWQAIVGSAPHLGRLSRERIKQEIEKTLEQVARPGRALEMWRDAGALERLLPVLARQPEAALAALDHLALPGASVREERRRARMANRMAVLFLGQPAADVRREAKELRLSNPQVAWVSGMAERWTALAQPMALALSAAHAPSDAALRRWAASAGRTSAAPFLRLVAARWSAERSHGMAAPPARAVCSAYRRLVRIAYRDPIELGDLAVDGEDLRDAGVPPGPALGKILRALLDEVVEDPSRNARDRLLARAAELAREMGDDSREG